MNVSSVSVVMFNIDENDKMQKIESGFDKIFKRLGNK